ncbi:MAG: N-acetylglucosamine-6-phosphate deacetylase [Bacteroidales bacterium]|nr:N-acetylglucosamine-6-phosphate deacetylase [Bacteroidales bacterium]
MIYALNNATVFTGKDKYTGKVILIESDTIKDIVDPASVPDRAKVLDYSGYSISPGLIDLQIAGGGGYLFSENPTAKALEAITESIIKNGTTGFLIAVPTNSFDTYLQLFEIIKQNPHSAVIGLHLEGPYINKERGGAHNRGYIKAPDKNAIKKLLEEADGVVKMITLAPELCDAEFVRIIRDYGVLVAAGHSNATFQEATTGFEWGVKAVTHLFNAMSQFHHRDPGLPGAAFLAENVYASIIADGIHVDYNAISIAKKIMKNRLYLVSDAVEENLDGAYLHTRQKDRFTLPDGTLSGSNLTILKAVKNCVQHVGLELDEALRMASTYPAKLMGIDNYGCIFEGHKANLTVFDEFYGVKQVIINGKFYL